MQMPAMSLMMGALLGLSLCMPCKAMTPEVEVKSRSLPETCEFVFRVESDLQVLYRADGAASVQLVYAYKDAYSQPNYWPNNLTSNQAEPQSRLLKALNDDPSRYGDEWTLLSMSTNPRFLYRRMNFYFRVFEGPSFAFRRDPEDKDSYYSVEFGREFGEPCYPDGRASTPYRERKVEIIRAPELEPGPHARF
jgi:hypothetical protein